MDSISSKPPLANDLYKNSFSIMPVHLTKKDAVLSKPIVNIQYINADELEGSFTAKPKKPTTTVGDNAEKPKPTQKSRQKPKTELFSLSNIGVGLMTIGSLDLTVKHYLSGSVLLGMGLLGYGIGYHVENRK